MNRTRPTHPRGSSLVLAMILLAVLAVIGVAAVKLGSTERVNAAAKGRRDMLVACAHAARIALWTAITTEGTGWVDASVPPSVTTLPDGTELMAPSAPTGSGMEGLPVVDLIKSVPLFSAEATAVRDITNTMADPRIAGQNGRSVVARCKDSKGRELLIELTIKFAI